MYFIPQFVHATSRTSTSDQALPSHAANAGGDKATALADRATALIAGNLSGDSRTFIKSNVQTGGE
jgi:hypothetical protein